MKRKTPKHLATGALAMALAGSVNAATIALFDFGDSRNLSLIHI